MYFIHLSFARWVDWMWLLYHDFYSLLQSSDLVSRSTLQAAWCFITALQLPLTAGWPGVAEIYCQLKKTPQNLRVESYVLFRDLTGRQPLTGSLKNWSKEVREEPRYIYIGVFAKKTKTKKTQTNQPKKPCSRTSKDYCWSQKADISS